MGRTGFVRFGAVTAGAVLVTAAVIVGVQASGGTAWWQAEPCDASGSRPAADAELRVAVHGQVTDPDGEPVEGVLVRATQPLPTSRHSSAAWPEWEDRTDADGCYEVQVALGTIIVVAEPDGGGPWATQELAGGEAGDRPALETSGANVRLDATVRPGATVSGQVTVPSAHPATAVLVRRDAPGWTPREVPVEDGRYAFAGLPAGTYVVGAHTTIGTGAYAPGVRSPDRARGVDVGAGETVDDLDVELPAPAVVTGRVDLPAGASLPDAGLNFLNGWGPTLTTSVPAVVDRRGRYRVELGAGSWLVAAGDGSCDPTALPQVRVRARDTALVRDLSLAEVSC